MAVTNASNAFASASPLQGSVVDLLSQQEQVDLQYDKMALDNAQQAAAQKQAKALADQKAKNDQLKDIQERYKAGIGNAEPIGAKDIDEANILFVNQAAEVYGKLKGEYLQKVENGSLTERDKADYEIKLQRLMRVPSELKTRAESTKNILTEYQKGRNTFDANGNPNLHEDPDLEKMIKGEGIYYPSFNFDSKDPYLIGRKDQSGQQTDVNNDGVINELDVFSYDDILKGASRFKFNTYYDRGDALKEDIAAIGFSVNQTDDGTNVNYSKTFDKNEISKLGQNRFFSPNGSITPFARSLALQNNIDPENTTEVQKLADAYKMDLVSSMKPEFKQTKKNSDLDWFKARQNNKKEPSTDDFAYTSVRKKGDKVIGDIYQIGGETVSRKLTGGSEEKLRGFEIGKDGIVYAVVDQERPKLTPKQFLDLKDPNKGSYEDYLAEDNFQTRKYSSKGSGSEADVVGFYYRQIKNPKGEYIENTQELKNLLEGNKPKQPKTEKSAPIQFDAQGNIIIN